MTLSKEELNALREKLESAKQEIETQIEHLEKGLDFGEDTDHFEEEADETEELANRLGVKNALGNRLKKIENALEKMADGKYGFCEKCGEEIDLKLLEADPESKLCRECKRL